MANYDRLIEEDRMERARSHKGVAEIYDGTHSDVNPIHVRFEDNGTAKYAVLSDKTEANMLYLQGHMVEQLYNQWQLKLGAFGPSEKKLQEEDVTTYFVRLTTKQLEALHKLLESGNL